MNWQKHNGTSQPTDDSKQVLVRRSDGSYDSGKASEFRWERRYLGGDARDITDWCEILEPSYWVRVGRHPETIKFTAPLTPELAKSIADIYGIAKIIDEQTKAQ